MKNPKKPKLRPAKKSDQREAEKAYRLLIKAMQNHPEIEPEIWASACWSALINGYIASNIPYPTFCQEIESITNFFKDRWS